MTYAEMLMAMRKQMAEKPICGYWNRRMIQKCFYGVGLYDLTYELTLQEHERQMVREWRGRCVETAVVLLLLGVALMIVTGGL